MILYHLTTMEKAEQIVESGFLLPSRFCGEGFEAVFMSEESFFDWLERDIILGGPNRVQDGVVVEAEFSDAIKWEHDPERENYGPWVCYRTSEPLPCTVLRVIQDDSWMSNLCH